jgi:hypothetical protein
MLSPVSIRRKTILQQVTQNTGFAALRQPLCKNGRNAALYEMRQWGIDKNTPQKLK